jgi:hypothetical protein
MNPRTPYFFVRTGCEFSGVQTLLALAMAYVKSGRRERCSQKNAGHAAAERGTECA